jgi:hypothetical protein
MVPAAKFWAVDTCIFSIDAVALARSLRVVKVRPRLAPFGVTSIHRKAQSIRNSRPDKYVITGLKSGTNWRLSEAFAAGQNPSIKSGEILYPKDTGGRRALPSRPPDVHPTNPFLG